MLETTERRCANRADFQAPVVMFVDNNRERAQAVDISPTGMGVVMRKPAPVGQFVRVNFTMPERDGSERWHDVDAIVSRSEARGADVFVGLHFAQMSTSLAARIREYIRARRDLEARRRAHLANLEAGRLRAAARAEAPTQELPKQAPNQTKPAPRPKTLSERLGLSFTREEKLVAQPRAKAVNHAARKTKKMSAASAEQSSTSSDELKSLFSAALKEVAGKSKSASRKTA